MALTAILNFGSFAGASGYRTIIDSVTTAGKVYFGVTKSGNQKSDIEWFILCLDKSTRGINDFEWAQTILSNMVTYGIKQNNKKRWDLRTTYIYQTD